MRGFTIARVMATIQLALHNSRKNPTIKAAIGAFGYDDTRMNEGDALYREVASLRFGYQVKRDNMLCAHETWKEKKTEAKSTYMKFLKLARRALSDCRCCWNLLAMNGRRSDGFIQWTDQARTFYHGAIGNEGILSRLETKYKISAQDLEHGLALIEEAITCHQTHVRLQGESKVARVEWDNCLGHLKKWYYALREILRIALDHIPPLITAVGLSSKRKPGKNKVFPLVEAFNLPVPPAALRGPLRGERQGAAPPGPPKCTAMVASLR